MKMKRQEVLPLVEADLRSRIAKGTAEYGEPLSTHNGRDALQDAYEEAMDLSLYLRQAIAEHDARKGGDTSEGCTLIDDRELELLRRKASVCIDASHGDLWYWQGDGQDAPETISCPVVMHSDVLRELLNARKGGGVSDAMVERAIAAARKADLYPGSVGYRIAAMRAALEAAGCGVDVDAVREVVQDMRWAQRANGKASANALRLFAKKLARAIGDDHD